MRKSRLIACPTKHALMCALLSDILFRATFKTQRDVLAKLPTRQSPQLEFLSHEAFYIMVLKDTGEVPWTPSEAPHWGARPSTG